MGGKDQDGGQYLGVIVGAAGEWFGGGVKLQLREG